jgi:sugar phosphate isomerase/epimerase
MVDRTSRRDFVKLAGLGLAATAVLGCAEDEDDDDDDERAATGAGGATDRVRLGMASYTFRNFPLDETLQMTRRLGLTRIGFKDFHLALDSTVEQIESVVGQVRAAGLELYGGGVIYMRSETEVHRAFDYAQAAGFEAIIGVPNHEYLDLVEQKVAEFDIKLAIHNHGPTDQVYPTPQSAYELIRDRDPRMGLCIDVGHTQRAAVDPAESAERFADRLHDVHIKDVTASTAAGSTIEIGRGVVDIPRFLRTLLQIEYGGTVAFEFEKDANDPLPGTAESVGYVRGVLATL